MKPGKASSLLTLLALSLVFGCAPSHSSVDKAGRITGFTRTTAANTPANTATFQYGANGNRKASTRSVAGTSTSVTYQYNSAGDLLSDGLTRYHYDSEGRLDSASTGQGPDAPTTKYAHNALGQRVFKTEPLYSSAAKQGTGKNLNNLLADDGEEEQEQPGLIQQLLNFFSKLWSPSTSDAEKLGFSYVYAEDGSLLGEYGSGGSASSGTAQYIYLPTASGPMPIAAIIKGQTYAIHSDHLNTPRKLTQADGQAAWQWAYSAFGEEQPTTGARRFTSEATTPSIGSTSIPEVTFNLRYPGQYFDNETKLHYNHFRSYDPRNGGRYTQADPIGLDGGWNRFTYVSGNPLGAVDPMGLDTVVVLGGTTGGNPLGHVAIGFTGQGVYSYGTNTPLGGKLTDYLASQAAYRDSFAYILKTTPDQEAKMREEILKYRGTPLPDPRKDPFGAARDTCATRTQSALEAGGITSILHPYISPFPRDTWRLARGNPGTVIVIPKGGTIPNDFSSFNR